jgi:DNA-binding PadR family transcriptional regulator
MRAGRMFEQGDLKIVILRLLDEKPRHGYEVIKAIEELFGGSYSPSPGAVYPTLSMLEDLGYAAVTVAEGNKRLYTLTDAGRAFLTEQKPVADGIFSRIAAIAGSLLGEPMSEVHRAVRNIGRAVYLREGRPHWTPEQAKRVTEILDQAAKDIEQI